MKGFPLSIIIFLIFGAVLSYIAAWACAALFYAVDSDKWDYQDYWITFSVEKKWYSPEESEEWYSSESSVGFAEIRDVNADYEIPFAGSRQFGKVLKIEHTERMPLRDTISLRALFDPDRQSNAMIITAGWPFPCCYATVSPPLVSSPRKGAIRIKSTSNVIYLPYRPLMIYLLLNSIFYGAVSFAGMKGVTSVIQRKRFAGGICPKCKYNLLGNYSRGCPECGWGREIK